MTDNAATPGRRARTLAGLGVITASLVVATVIAGVGFASGSVSAAQYQYGKVTICHHTHSKKHPTVTIRISQHAWRAHQRHGDTLGACAPAAPTTSAHGHDKGHGKGHDKGKGDDSHHSSTTTTTTTSTTAPKHGHGDDDGNGNGKGHKK
ncbi:MAG: hypothetical protein ACXVRJ_08125 [Gaiellaceae bacterium]